MYGNDDPRAALATAIRPAAPTDATAPIRPPQYVEFDDATPAELSPAGSRTWYLRAQNFVLGLTRLRAGDSLTRAAQPHEYVVLMTDEGASLTVEAGGEIIQVDEPVLVVVPPGDSVVTARTDLTVTRLFDIRTEDLAAKAGNAEAYETPDPRVRPFEPWPDPTEGHRLRAYFPERIEPAPGRFGRIFRTSAFMVNFLDLQEGPRDPEKLSPHHHNDFEQCSLAVAGEYVHHIRTPWTPRRSQWHEDEHQHVGTPSVAIIPPPTVHTSEAVADGHNRLIDIFCPPREDFSAQDGWVLNAREYPRP